MERKKHVLLDHLISVLGVKNDAGLARKLSLSPPIISKIRCGVHPVTPSILIVMHEESDIGLKVLRFLAGDYREHTGASAKLISPDAAEAFLRQAA